MSLDKEEARMLRRILDDVLTDPRFITQSSVSALNARATARSGATLVDAR